MSESSIGADRNRDGLHSRRVLRSFVEFAVVAGLGLLAIFVVIPAQTTPGDELGLGPAVVPTVCAATIVLFAAIQFLRELFKPAHSSPAADAQVPVHYVGLLMVATLAGIAALVFGGLVGGCAVTVTVVALALGTRDVKRLVALAGGAALVAAVVLKLGI